MTIEQGNQINTLYKSYRDQIDLLKVDTQLNRVKIDSLQRKYDSLGRLMYEAMQYKWKYEANKEIFLSQEKDQRGRDRLHEISKGLLILIILIQFGTISSLHK